MAGFRMHVGTSTVLGCGYAAALAAYGVPADTAIMSGAMCGFGGMLPDLDSDYGVPLREIMAFAAATIPMLMVHRFEALGLGFDAMALATVGMYLFVRFGLTNIIRKFTVHRGMFHSIPAMLIFGGIAFLVCGGSPFDLRCFKAGGLMGGVLSHLVLDEIYAVEWKGGRWRKKKSFGTAMKLWGDNRWSNVAAYSKVALVGLSILGEPSVMQHISNYNPQLASQITDLRNQVQQTGLPQNNADLARAAMRVFNNAQQQPQQQSQFGAPASNWPQYSAGPPAGPQPFNAPPPQQSAPPQQWQWPTNQQPYNNGNSFDTAQRPGSQFPQ